jgi:hypothetical protein
MRRKYQDGIEDQEIIAKERNKFLANIMSSRVILSLVALFGFALNSASAATCEVPGGTSDDGPAIKAALATCNNGGTVLLDKTYTIASVLETTSLNNVAIELTGTIILSPGMSPIIVNWMLSDSVKISHIGSLMEWP